MKTGMLAFAPMVLFTSLVFADDSMGKVTPTDSQLLKQCMERQKTNTNVVVSKAEAPEGDRSLVRAPAGRCAARAAGAEHSARAQRQRGPGRPALRLGRLRQPRAAEFLTIPGRARLECTAHFSGPFP
jgi:hypothetical protein